MSDTPETDAVEAWPASKLKLGNDSFVPAEFARRLERERDEVRETLANEISFHHRTHSELIEAQCKLLDVTMERDEARDQVNHYRDKLDLLPIKWDI